MCPPVVGIVPCPASLSDDISFPLVCVSVWRLPKRLHSHEELHTLFEHPGRPRAPHSSLPEIPRTMASRNCESAYRTPYCRAGIAGVVQTVFDEVAVSRPGRRDETRVAQYSKNGREVAAGAPGS
jgi:hypothetical protein